MNKCCICGTNIQGEALDFLFLDHNGQEMEYCNTCDAKFQQLSQRLDEKTRNSILSYFHRYAKTNTNIEVKKYLENFLEDAGYFDPAEKEATAEEDAPAKTQRTGWSAVMRSLVWLTTIGSVILSIVLGVIIGEIGDGRMGVAVAIIGFVSSLLSPIWIMILLDAADDLHTVRTILSSRTVRASKKDRK